MRRTTRRWGGPVPGCVGPVKVAAPYRAQSGSVQVLCAAGGQASLHDGASISSLLMPCAEARNLFKLFFVRRESITYTQDRNARSAATVPARRIRHSASAP
jgi:hypothetical protein